jgi:hypothetical protein
LPALQRLARVPQVRPHAALPPLRFAEAVPRACPDCGNLDIAPMGRGTEKLEEQVAALLPGARVARIDADTTRRGQLEAQLAAVHAGEVDVLVGTQMVAKGHDFRRMTLVAAVNPDGALFSSDFRAPERLFALLMQAAGRAGRDAGRPPPARCGSRPGTLTTRCTRPWPAMTTPASPPASSTSGGEPACRPSAAWRCCGPKRAKSTPPPASCRRPARRRRGSPRRAP